MLTRNTCRCEWVQWCREYWWWLVAGLREPVPVQLVTVQSSRSVVRKVTASLFHEITKIQYLCIFQSKCINTALMSTFITHTHVHHFDGHLPGQPELYCLVIAADSIVDAIIFIRHIILWSKSMFSRNLAPVRLEIVKSGTVQPMLNPSYSFVDCVCTLLTLSGCCLVQYISSDNPIWSGYVR